MTEEQLDRIVRHQVKASLKERGLSLNELTEREYNLELYHMALKLMSEVN